MNLCVCMAGNTHNQNNTTYRTDTYEHGLVNLVVCLDRAYEGLPRVINIACEFYGDIGLRYLFSVLNVILYPRVHPCGDWLCVSPDICFITPYIDTPPQRSFLPFPSLTPLCGFFQLFPFFSSPPHSRLIISLPSNSPPWRERENKQ